MPRHFLSCHSKASIEKQTKQVFEGRFKTCICSNVETVLSWTCHVYGPFEFRTSLGTSILLHTGTLFTYLCLHNTRIDWKKRICMNNMDGRLNVKLKYLSRSFIFMFFLLTSSCQPFIKQNRSTEGCSKLKRSVDMTSSGKNGLNIRTNASPKWDRTRCPEE